MTDPLPNLATIALPLRITELAESFIIRDAAGYSVNAVYFDDRGDEISRHVRKRMTRETALAVAQVCARALTEAVERARATNPTLTQADGTGGSGWRLGDS